MKIKCLTLSLPTNRYRTSKGNEYLFNIGRFTEVKDSEDVEFFLKAGQGKSFEAESISKTIIEKVKEVIGIKKYTEQELYRLDKKEQEKIISKLDPHAKMPVKETERVAMIIKLQIKEVVK